jgi:tripartite-type tricarboxylate transporter receptor subunit TctC
MQVAHSFMAVASMLLIALGTAAPAQDFPNRPVRFIAPFPAGGGTDILARTIAQHLTETWGQQVIVDNRPGATGIIGTDIAKNASADGHTLLLGNAATHAVNLSVYKKLPYHPVRDFEHISLVARLPEMLVVHPSSPAKSVKDLIAIARSKPGQLTFGSAGVGSPPHLAGELFKSMAKVEITHVPYKGSPLALNDLMGGQIDMYFSNILTAIRLVKSGKLKALAITSAKRSNVAPDLPTIAESGLTGYEEYNWYVVVAPRGTPKPVVQKLSRDIAAGLRSKQVAALLTNDGAEIVASSPEECTRFIEDQIRKYARIVKEAKITPL